MSMISRSRGPELYGGVLSTFFLQYVLSTSHLNKQTNKKNAVKHFIANNISQVTIHEPRLLTSHGFPIQVVSPNSCQQNLDSGFLSLVVYRIPWAVLRNSRTKDSGFHKPEFPGFGDPHFPTWGDIGLS